MLRESKHVTWRHLQPGQEIEGYTLGCGSHSFSAIVKEANAAFVTVYAWGDKNKAQTISSDAIFDVEMSDEEFCSKYRDGAAACLAAIQNRLQEDKIGYHEMCNSWLYGTPYEMAAACQKDKTKIVGHCTEIAPKHAMFSGDILDVGVCAEYADGERFWCHFRSDDIKDLLRRYGAELGVEPMEVNDAKQ